MLSDACDSNLPFAAWLKSETDALVSATSVLEQRGADYYGRKLPLSSYTQICDLLPCALLKLEQSMAIPDFRAARRPRLSPRP
eukprot:3373341-Amphidinium_carterae.3